MFLWLVVHGRILTTSERCRRHLSTDALCMISRQSEESTNACIKGQFLCKKGMETSSDSYGSEAIFHLRYINSCVDRDEHAIP